MIFDNRETAGRLLGEWLKEKLGEEGNYIEIGRASCRERV